jgi:hypothetical protein
MQGQGIGGFASNFGGYRLRRIFIDIGESFGESFRMSGNDPAGSGREGQGSGAIGGSDLDRGSQRSEGEDLGDFLKPLQRAFGCFSGLNALFRPKNQHCKADCLLSPFLEVHFCRQKHRSKPKNKAFLVY